MASASVKKASCVSRPFSVTSRSLRKPCSHASVRSANQRNTPSPLPCPVFRRASCGSK